MDVTPRVPSLLTFIVLMSLSHFGLAEGTPIYFEDCSVLDFGEQDTSSMTEAEKIRAMDQSLFRVLDQTEECMDSAVQSSAESVANAAGQGASGGQGAAGAAGTSGSTSEVSSSQSKTSTDSAATNTQTTSTQTSTSKKTIGGQAKGGSSAVCDAVNTGLQSATTESEKAHFQELKKQYGCN